MANVKAKGERIGRTQMTKDDIPVIFYKYYPAHTSRRMNICEPARVCRMISPAVYKYPELIK